MRPRQDGEEPEHAAGDRQRGQRHPGRGAQRGRAIRIAPEAERIGRRGEHRHEGELGARQRRQTYQSARERGATSGQRHQLEEEHQQSEGGRVGVWQDEVVGRTGEADGKQQGGGEACIHRGKPAPAEPIERREDCCGLKQPKPERGGEGRAEERERAGERIQADRPVEVPNVGVRQRSMRDQVSG